MRTVTTSLPEPVEWLQGIAGFQVPGHLWIPEPPPQGSAASDGLREGVRETLKTHGYRQMLWVTVGLERWGRFSGTRMDSPELPASQRGLAVNVVVPLQMKIFAPEKRSGTMNAKLSFSLPVTARPRRLNWTS